MDANLLIHTMHLDSSQFLFTMNNATKDILRYVFCEYIFTCMLGIFRSGTGGGDYGTCIYSVLLAIPNLFPK